MLLKNIVENKVHKEKMQMLYAFEQMIINTEDENDPDYYDEEYGEEGEEDPNRIAEDSKEDEEDYDEEEDSAEGGISGPSMKEKQEMAMAALHYYRKHKMFPPMSRIPIEAEYMSNPSDVIDEEEFEESVADPNSPSKKFIKPPILEGTKGQPSEIQKPLYSKPPAVPGKVETKSGATSTVNSRV